MSLIFRFIQKKADFDRQMGAFSGNLAVTEQKIRDTLFKDVPFAYVLFAEQSEEPCGFALYGFRYSSFAGQPSLWLDDLFINEGMRSQGAGTLLMEKLTHIALQHHCTHIGWTADARNLYGLRFYQQFGAEITAQQGYRCFLRWTPPSN